MWKRLEDSSPFSFRRRHRIAAQSPHSNAFTRDDAERPAGCNPEENNATTRRQSKKENELTEILIEREKDPLLARAHCGDFHVGDAGTFLGDLKYFPPGFSQ